MRKVFLVVARNLFLLVGFLVVSILFRDHGPRFYTAAAVVYLIYKAMGEHRSPKSSSAAPQIRTELNESATHSLSSDATNAGAQNSSESPNVLQPKDSGLPPLGAEPSPGYPEIQLDPHQLPEIALVNHTPDRYEEAQSDCGGETPTTCDLSGPLVKLRSFATSAEALLAAGFLGSMGLECLVTSQSQLAVGEIALMIKPEDLEAAQSALKDIENREAPKLRISDHENESIPLAVPLRTRGFERLVNPSVPAKRTPWLAIGFVTLLAIVFLGKTAYMLIDSRESTDQGLEYVVTHRESVPTAPIFDTAGCVTAGLNEVAKAANAETLTPHRAASIKWLCSRDWDQARLSKDAAMLRANGLSLCQVLAAVDPKNPRTADCNLSGLRDELAAFFVVFDSVPVIELMENTIHPLPKYRTGAEAQMFGRVIKRPKSDLQQRILRYTSHKTLPVDYYEDLVLARQQAREYRFTQSPLNLRIITDSGLRTCFRDLFNGAYSSPSMVSGKWHDESPVLSATEPEDEIDTNFSVGMICIGVKMLVVESAGMIQSLPESDFRDLATIGTLTMILLHSDTTSSGVSTAIADREGWYDPDTSTLGVTSVAGLNFERTTTEANLRIKVQQLLPAALSHEIYHHIFYRPSIASSGFELEGEATVLGEREHQLEVLGTEAPVNDPIMVLWRKINKQLNEQPDQQEMAAIWDEYVGMNDLITARYKAAKFTPMQCNALRIVTASSGGQNRLNLSDALTLTPGDFQNSHNVATLYAFAWAIYHHLYEDNKSELIHNIQKIHEKQHAYVGISAEDRQELDAIVTDTIQWARTEKRRRNECR